jgi:hypothetical protein
MYNVADGVHDQETYAAYAPRAVLDDRVCDSLLQTNLAFFEVVIARHTQAPARPVLGLAAETANGILRLDAKSRAAAASCPYTLFNMAFEDCAFWSRVALDARGTGVGSLADEATFARTAVYLAWHLAQSGDLAAALVLGMTPEVLQAWRALPLSAIDRAAMAGCMKLQARWGRNHHFWSRLLEAAVNGGRPQLEAVRLLGLQLLAAGGLGAAAWVREPPGSA